MRIRTITISLLVLALPGLAQQQPPVLTQVVTCVKVQPGKAAEFREFTGIITKMMKTRVDAGRMRSWSLLRSVMPLGSEARCDYLNSIFYEGPPAPPVTTEETEKALQAAGLHMTAAEFYAKRDAVSRRVATEMWRVRERVGTPAKGSYVFLNYMKVAEPAEYTEFEHQVWRPMAEQWVKDGAMNSWIFATKMLPGGAETPYGAYSADVFPNWEAVFKPLGVPGQFAKAHPDRNYQQTMNRLEKLRTLAQRQLFVIEERLAK